MLHTLLDARRIDGATLTLTLALTLEAVVVATGGGNRVRGADLILDLFGDDDLEHAILLLKLTRDQRGMHGVLDLGKLLFGREELVEHGELTTQAVDGLGEITRRNDPLHALSMFHADHELAVEVRGAAKLAASLLFGVIAVLILGLGMFVVEPIAEDLSHDRIGELDDLFKFTQNQNVETTST